MLTAKQQRFVAEYLKTGHLTKSAIAAGYSKKTAHTIGHENINKPEIAAAIAAGQADRIERTKVDMDYVLTRLAIEAERDDERSSHSARVAALGQLRAHLSEAPTGDESPSINVNLTVSTPVSEVRVTRHNA